MNVVRGCDMAFDLLTKFRREPWVLSEAEQHAAMAELLLDMLIIVNRHHTGESQYRETDKKILHALSKRYDVDAEAMFAELYARDEIDRQRVHLLCEQLADNIPYDARILLLRDLWAIAEVDGDVDSEEKRYFDRVANSLGISGGDVLDHCIKIRKKSSIEALLEL